jgi:hypothetical protein
VPARGEATSTVRYQVDGRTYTTQDLGDLSSIIDPHAGMVIPLEVATDDPATVRVAGDYFPNEDGTAMGFFVVAGSGTGLGFLLANVRDRLRVTPPAG